MQKNFTSYIKTIEGNLFQFICEPNAQTAHAKEFLFEVIKWVGDIEAFVKAQEEQKKAQDESAPATSNAQEPPKQEAA